MAGFGRVTHTFEQIGRPARHFRGVTPVRLGDHFHGADFKSGKSSVGDRCTHDDRHGMLAHELSEEGQAVHARHFDVEQHHGWNEFFEHLDGFVGVAGGGHFESGVGFDDGFERLAHNGAIVNNQNVHGCRTRARDGRPGGTLADHGGHPSLR